MFKKLFIRTTGNLLLLIHNHQAFGFKRWFSMRVLAVVFLNLFFFNVLAQRKDTTAAGLAKYAYLLYGDIYPPVKPYGLVKATGFFVTHRGKTYLVTANHVLTGWNGYRQQGYYPKLWYVRLTDNQHKTYKFVPLNLKYLKVSNVTMLYTQSPDLCFYEMHLPAGYKVYTINPFIKNLEMEVGSTLLTYGYPPHGISTKAQSVSLKPEGAALTLLTDAAPGYRLKLADGVLDFVNYRAQYPRYEPVGPGYSGSPVFYKKAGTIAFAGVLASGQADLVYIVKPHFLTSGLKSIR